MLIFVTTELMFFAALVSSHTVIRSGAGLWAPPESVRLPIITTAFNTAVLLFSGFFLWLAGRDLKKPIARTYFALAIVTGLFFVCVQGYEWTQLLKYGMTMTSGVFGATFFLLVGSHGLHAAAGVIAMAVVYLVSSKKELTRDQFRALQIFWFFIVAVWLVFYGLVYF